MGYYEIVLNSWFEIQIILGSLKEGVSLRRIFKSWINIKYDQTSREYYELAARMVVQIILITLAWIAGGQETKWREMKHTTPAMPPRETVVGNLMLIYGILQIVCFSMVRIWIFSVTAKLNERYLTAAAV